MEADGSLDSLTLSDSLLVSLNFRILEKILVDASLLFSPVFTLLWDPSMQLTEIYTYNSDFIWR